MDVRNIAVVQLDGVSELLASASAIRALKMRHPGAKIHLFTSNPLLEIADFLPGVDCISESCAETSGLRMDLLVNLGFTGQSLLAAKRISAGEILGPRLNSDSAIVLDDGWSRYHESVVPNKALNPFHRAEILSSVAGLQWLDPDYALRVDAEEARQASARRFADYPHIKVAVAPGALDQDECEEMISLLRNAGFSLRFYFLGTLKDRPAVASLFRHMGPAADICSNLSGDLSLRETALLTYGSDIVIAPPGEGALMSSGFGTFTICPMGHSASSLLDLPLGQGHICVQREAADGSRGRAAAESVAHAITAGNGGLPSLAQWQGFFDERIPDHIGRVRIFHTARTLASGAAPGAKSELRLLPLVFSGADFTESCLLFHRIQWESVLNESSATERTLDLPQELAVRQLRDMAGPLGQLAELAMFGQRHTTQVMEHIRHGRPEKAHAEANKLQEIDDLIRSVAGRVAASAPITSYFFINQSQIFDVSPVDVAEKIRLCYVLLQHQAVLMLDLIARSTDPTATGLDKPQISHAGQEATHGQP